MAFSSQSQSSWAQGLGVCGLGFEGFRDSGMRRQPFFFCSGLGLRREGSG